MNKQNYLPPPPPPPTGNDSLRPRKLVRRLVFASALRFTLAACEPPAPPVTNPPAGKPKPPAGTSITTIVRGTVTDTVGNVEAAEISVSVPGVPKVLTSAAGAYRLTVKHSGSFTLRAVKEGYTPKTTKVTTTQGTREQNFILNLIETPAFESSAVRKSKMLITTNRDSAGNIKIKPSKTPF